MVPEYELIQAIESRGFNINDCPFMPFDDRWLDFPIVVAIKEAEKETGIKYTFSESDYKAITE